VEHFVFCHPDSSLLNTAVFCIFMEKLPSKTSTRLPRPPARPRAAPRTDAGMR
jgi:hypothetical protein